MSLHSGSILAVRAHSLTSLHSGAIDAAMVDEVSRGFWFSVLFPIRQVLSVYPFLKKFSILKEKIGEVDA